MTKKCNRSRANVIKRFCTYFKIFRNELVFVLGKAFQPSLMFVGKAGCLFITLHFLCNLQMEPIR
jgi:hypothetical protein